MGTNKQPTVVEPVRKSVTVEAPAEHAFAVFTERPADWWPANHVLVNRREAIVFEPRIGGRWYEREFDGSERDWGRVLAWDPPHRLVLSWMINGEWKPISDDTKASEIQVTFTPQAPNRTVVELAHVDLHRHGADAQVIRDAIAGPSPGDTLANFADAVHRHSGRRQ
jgi:uncharacterized protein YndB with AHSA1/START domain